MNPKASVIIPVYNAEKTLRRCVESLVLGLERDIEVILCEDQSKDSSWQLCCELSKEFDNVRCVQNGKNSGVSHTRNQGLNIATGEYILFVDSDDWVSGSYAAELIRLAKGRPEGLSVCGHYFIDKVKMTKGIYRWSDESRESVVEVDGFFDLCERFFLQQLWNKIFRRDLIETHHIRFDESQSMGEDFQFVLDYLEASQIQKCHVLNEPLYYYIRWNQSSLISNFGFIDKQSEIERFEKLARIVGPEAENKKIQMVRSIKENQIYHIARNRTHSKREKLNAIKAIAGGETASALYRKQRLQFVKERMVERLGEVKQLNNRMKGRIQRKHAQKRTEQLVSGVDAEGITFISQNCIGGVLYHDLGLKFLSPTINCFIPEPDFMKFVGNLRYYMSLDPVMHWGEEYPIGTLDDVNIHFMHYNTCKEAKETWNERKTRINWDKIFVLGTDRDGFDMEAYEYWQKVSYAKILFTAHPEFEEDSVFYPEYTEDGQIGDLIPDRHFYRDNVLIEKIQNAVWRR